MYIVLLLLVGQQLDITNIRPFPITWKISSLAPAYVKVSATFQCTQMPNSLRLFFRHMKMILLIF